MGQRGRKSIQISTSIADTHDQCKYPTADEALKACIPFLVELLRGIHADSPDNDNHSPDNDKSNSEEDQP